MSHIAEYKDWKIYYDPKPIPSRNYDYDAVHENYDGAPDAGSLRDLAISAKSIEEAKQMIDENENKLNWD